MDCDWNQVYVGVYMLRGCSQSGFSLHLQNVLAARSEQAMQLSSLSCDHISLRLDPVILFL